MVHTFFGIEKDSYFDVDGIVPVVAAAPGDHLSKLETPRWSNV